MRPGAPAIEQHADVGAAATPRRKIARSASDDNPTGALQISYDAAREAAIALLSAQGLRGTTEPGHRAIAAAGAAQFDGTFDRLERMRRRRNAAEYPDIGTPEVTQDDARDAIDAAHRMYYAVGGLCCVGQHIG